MLTTNNNSAVLWVGGQVKLENNNNNRLKENKIKCYKKCIYGSLTINIGDFVMISNADTKNSDFTKEYDVACIRILYQLEDVFSPFSHEPFRAVVQWYSWPQSIPEKCFNNDDINFDFDKEIIEEHRPYDNDISIETISNKCAVIVGDIRTPAVDLLKSRKFKIPVYVCRYKFIKHRYYKLCPLIEDLKCKTIKNRKTINSRSKLNEENNNEQIKLLNKSEINGQSIAEVDILDYSIVPKAVNDDDLKITLKISQKYNGLYEEPIKENFDDNLQCNISKIIDPLSFTMYEKTSSKNINKTRRKSILKTSGDVNPLNGTPKKSIQLSDVVEKHFYDTNDVQFSSILTDNQSNKTKYKEINDNQTTPKKRPKIIKVNNLTPSIVSRENSICAKMSDLHVVRENLHVSIIPNCLPCRESEYKNIYNFIEHKIISETGGCMYISGVPGTGKTATVTKVIEALKLKAESEELPNFESIDINGMRLAEPRQAYVSIYKQLTGKLLPWEQSYTLLEKRFSTSTLRRKAIVLLVDELDILCNRRQDVVYNLLDWPSKSTAKLIVITIANTMDLPERLLLSKVTSRLGLTRLTFQPYSHKQLQTIVTSRLIRSNTFNNDAVQLVARKVAAVSGDARRALDICRRATEIAEDKANNKKNIVDMIHVQKALEEMISSAKVQAIKSCSKMEKIFLQSISAEVRRTGLEEVVFSGVYTQMESISAFMNTKLPSITQVFKICSKLSSQRLIISEHSRNDIYQKIILNVDIDDIHFALQDNLN